MKAIILLALLSIALVASSPPDDAGGSDNTRDPAAGFLRQSKDPWINSFWTQFKAAVIKGDKNLVATMSQFPIEMSYGIAPIKNRTQFIRRYREIFSEQADAKTCFGEAKPVVEASVRNRFSVGCKDAAGNEVVIYAFVRTRTGWKFKSLDNLNE